MAATCVFCDSSGPFTTVEHVIPESLGNDDLLLRDEVCDACQRYFGKDVEKYVLEKTPIGAWRSLLGIRSKRGRLPRVDLSVSSKPRGVLPEYSSHHDNRVGFAAHEDGSTSIDVDDPEITRRIADGSKTDFGFVLSPKHLIQLGRFLGKIAIELYCSADPVRARHERYAALRRYARYGISREIWPLFHRTIGTLADLRELETDSEGIVQHSLCYDYSLLEHAAGFELFTFRVGTDQWVICTNDPFPPPIIRAAFPDEDLTLIWYARSEWTESSDPDGLIAPAV